MYVYTTAGVCLPCVAHLKSALERKALQERTGEHTYHFNRIECGECKLNYASAETVATATAAAAAVTKSKWWARALIGSRQAVPC